MEKSPKKGKEQKGQEQTDGITLDTHPFIGDQVAVFHGPNSESWDIKKVNQAKKLEKQGVSRNDIWKQTGVFRNSNGDWRMEISDYGIKVKQIPDKGRSLKLGDVIDHPELFKAYPHLKNMPIRGYASTSDVYGFEPVGYYESRFQNIHMKIPAFMTTGGTKRPARDEQIRRWTRTLVHELQHAIQHIEKPRSKKFAGDNAQMIKDMKAAGYDVSEYAMYASWWREVDSRMVELRLNNPPSMNKDFVPIPLDTDIITVDKEPNMPPGKQLATHKAGHHKAMDTVTISNIHKTTTTPFQDDPNYQKGNSKGANDQSGGFAPSKHRNVTPSSLPAPGYGVPSLPVSKKTPKLPPASNPGDRAGINTKKAKQAQTKTQDKKQNKTQDKKQTKTQGTA